MQHAWVGVIFPLGGLWVGESEVALGLAEAGQRGQDGLCLTGKPFLPFKPQPLGLGAFLASICVFTFQVQTSTSESSGAGSVTMPNAQIHAMEFVGHHLVP